MKWYHKELHFQTAGRRAYLNITSEIAACLAESGINEGPLLCNAIHVAASIFINDDESGMLLDVIIDEQGRA